MPFQKTPYYLRSSIDEIVMNAREHITIHYVRDPQAKRGMGCKITDHNDYREYFYEPNKYSGFANHVIISSDQMSAHQNAVIALKKWEDSVREFLENGFKKEETESEKKSHDNAWDEDIQEPLTQLESPLQVVASEQMNQHGEIHETHTSDHPHQGV